MAAVAGPEIEGDAAEAACEVSDLTDVELEERAAADDAKHAADGHTALLSQAVLAAFIHEGHLASHVRRSRAIYDERRIAALAEAGAFGKVGNTA